MPLIPAILKLLAHLSRVCGFDTVDSFPPGHAYARTHWNRAYFDIASDLKPEQIERTLCSAITNTPSIFAYISNPTPRMQRALLAVIETRMRRSCGAPAELVALLIGAYRSPYTLEAIPGLRAAIEQGRSDDMAAQVLNVLDFLGARPSTFDASTFDVIEAGAQTPARLPDSTAPGAAARP